MTGRKGTERKSPPRRRKSRGRGGGSRHRWGWGLAVGAMLMVAAYIVGSYFFLVTPLSYRWKAMYGEPDYPEGFDIMGIDVSHHQGIIDWERLRNARINGRPLRFVMVKATEGTTLIDENLNENFYRVRENNLVRGAYHYFKPGSDAHQQALFYLKQVHLQEGDLPPILDVEERGNKSLRDFQQDVLAWLRLAEEAYGTPPIIYTGYKFKLDYLGNKAFDRYPLWIAHYYEKKLRYTGPWAFWQYTDCGRADGIRGTVDFNLFNGDARALMRLTLQPDDDEPQE